MSAEDSPLHPPNGNGGPIKLSFGTGTGVGLNKKKAPLKKTGSNAFGHNEERTETHDELISGLQGNKIESVAPKEEAKLLVIPKLENADWRQQALAKRKMTFNPKESLAQPNEIREEAGKTLGFGLQLQKRVKLEHQEPAVLLASESGAMDIDTATTTTITTAVSTKEEKGVIPQEEETLDQVAARKIIQAASGEVLEDARTLVLRGQENVHADEVEAFQKNLDLLPDEASLEDYEKVPVEDFGAALLRGMGWKGDSKGSEAIEFHRRPALLGLGAKPKEPEPITKKYIKPGESRTPQAVRVPERHRTGLPRSSGQRGDHRDSHYSRDDRDSRDNRDNTDSRDNKGARDESDRRADRGRRAGDDEKNRRDGRESRSSVGNRRGGDEIASDRDHGDHSDNRDRNDSGGSRKGPDYRHRSDSRERRRDSSMDQRQYRDRDRDRDGYRDRGSRDQRDRRRY